MPGEVGPGDRELTVGIIGAGYIANAHAAGYGAASGVRIAAVADPVPAKAERLAGRVGATAMTDARRLIESGVDIVSICTPSPTHADLAVAALEAGLDVLCEKPIARTLDDARRIVAAGDAATGRLMIGHVSRFEPDHARSKQIVDAGRIGELRMMSQSILSTLPTWSQGGWLSDLDQSGGPLVDLAIHSFDYLAWINGSPAVRVHALTADTDAGPETYALATVRYANGAIGLVETSWAHPGSHGFKLSTELMGSAGRVHWDYDHLIGGQIHTAEGTTKLDPLGSRGFQGEIAAFVAAIRAGEPAPISAAEGFESFRTALGALESARTGTTIDLTTWGLS
ncbi:MAG: gfo/Idh/MocA family oxidoreductase [Ilumatobacteraceae bacterium]|nr:gfo/Idh/MocA family oxidoreductase [Ilumatobacteraceae bacterium]